ncbi:hypothetical protein [Streptomyces sp. CB03238]|uniref:hypothetical protein n=1 Tax=Streptomyces sp. CB03238 TaxID=1907777 RepID=UPI001F4DA11B|nr:hypothetical protein [Streptomyces sp. CB03238]
MAHDSPAGAGQAGGATGSSGRSDQGAVLTAGSCAAAAEATYVPDGLDLVP